MLRMLLSIAAVAVWASLARAADAPQATPSVQGGATAPAGRYDVVVVQATPGGIMAAIAASRGGASVLLLERTSHVGGLPANGLGATDIGTRGATGGLFAEFVGRVKAHYVTKYGPDSQQVKDCSDGFHFESSVAERVFEGMLAEHPKITVLKGRQFDAKRENVELAGGGLVGLTVTDRATGKPERYAGKVFV
ncbi:MAG: dependent oxidoreductase, partial [Phycisphaerales bacterium]|nr:dependent oxidoreductase [Phycisphaerales bacterium]